jgi:hypothetical protein
MREGSDAIKLKRLVRFPPAVLNAHIDVCALGVPARFAAVPGQSDSSGANRPLCVEHRFQRDSAFKTNCFPCIMNDLGHVQRDDDPSPFVIFVKQRWIDWQNTSGGTFCAALAMRSDSSTDMASGFPQSALLPALAAEIAVGAWR